MIGKNLSQFEITADLGHGGMGDAYRAPDTRLDRQFSIQVPAEEGAAHPECLAPAGASSRVLRRRASTR